MNWTPDETASLLRGETVVRWVEMEEQPENEPVPAYKWPMVQWCAPSLWIWSQKCGCEKSIHAPHCPGDRAEVECHYCHGIGRVVRDCVNDYIIPCPLCSEWGGVTAICTAVEAERRRVVLETRCSPCQDVRGYAGEDCLCRREPRWGWREEWRRDDG